MKLHDNPNEDITRTSERKYGKIAAHDIAAAFGRVPADVAAWLEILPDDRPAFADIYDWVVRNTPSVAPALQALRRHYVTRAWTTKDGGIEFRLDHPALNAAWTHALRYAGQYARQDPNEGHAMLIASREEQINAAKLIKINLGPLHARQLRQDGRRGASSQKAI